MTTRYRTVIVPVERREFESRQCDGCGRALPENYNSEGFNRRELTILFRQGRVYPEGGSLSGWAVEDLCETCVLRLRTLLSQNGFTVTETLEDW